MRSSWSSHHFRRGVLRMYYYYMGCTWKDEHGETFIPYVSIFIWCCDDISDQKRDDGKMSAGSPTCPVSQRAQSAFFLFPFSYFHSVCIKLCALLSSPDCHDDDRQAGATGCKEYTRRIKSRYNAIPGECTLIFSLVSLLSGPQNVFSARKTLRHSRATCVQHQQVSPYTKRIFIRRSITECSGI
jgi:hypothetical protein